MSARGRLACGAAERVAAVLAGGLAVGLLAPPAGAAPPTWMTRFNGGSQVVLSDPPSLPQGGWMFGGSLGSRSMAVDAQGHVYVAGTVSSATGGDDFLVEKYDPQGNLVWYRTTDGGAQLDDTVSALAYSAIAGAVYVTGKSCQSGGDPCGSDLLTIKYDATTGATLWAALADGPAHSRDFGPRIAVNALGTPFVAGTTDNDNSANYTDFLVIKYNQATGVEAWRQTATTASGSSQDVVGALGVGADGHVVVTGSGDERWLGLATLLTVKIDTGNGAQIWAHTANTLHQVYPYAIVLDAASNPIVAGETDKFADPKFFVLKYQAANGHLGWLKNVNYAPAGHDDAAHDLTLDGGGNVYVTGRARFPGGGGYSFHTVKYEALFGTELWAHSFGSGIADDDYVPTAIAHDAVNNRVVVAGYHQTATSRDLFVESLNSGNGNNAPLQVATDLLAYDLAVDVAIDPAGNALVAGGAASLTDRDLVVLSYGSTLLERWRAADPDGEPREVLGSLSPPQYGRRKIAVDAVGNTVVVGSTAPTPNSGAIDFLVQKYGPGGNLLWSRTIGTVGVDQGVAVALAGTSEVYVTGSSDNGTGHSHDIFTLRLDAVTGATIWEHRYDGPAGSSDAPTTVVLGSDRVFVVGSSHDGAHYNFIALGYPRGNGAAPWVTSLDVGGPSHAYAAAVGCRDTVFGECIEGVYLTGMAVDASGPGAGNQLFAALLDGDSGAALWGGTQGGGDTAGHAIAAFGSPATVVATGRANGNWITTAFQGSSSPPLWTITRDFDGLDDQAYDVAFDPAGNAFVTGVAVDTPDLNRQAATVKYDATTGAELAVHRFGVSQDDATAYGVATDFAGNVYLGGSRSLRTSGRSDLLFLKYTNDLILAGGGFVDSAGDDDRGSALAVERSSGDAVVAGTSFATAAAGDLLLAKYRAFELGRFFTVAPCRLYDSRNDSAGPLAGGQTRVISAMGFVGNCSLLTPAAKALAINVTVIAPTAGGNLSLYPGNVAAPGTSTVNFAAGQTRANNMLLRLATDAAGTFAVRAGLPSGATTHVVIDVSGYFD